MDFSEDNSIIVMFKKIYNYFVYRNAIKKNWPVLSSEDFAMTRTWGYQFGTIINMPDDVIELGPNAAKQIVYKYVNKVEKECQKMRIFELVVLRSIKQIDSFNYKVVFDYYAFNTNYMVYGVFAAIAAGIGLLVALV